MTALCKGCQRPLPLQTKGRSRVWCSERCRRDQYAGECIDCGGSTNPGIGKEGKRCASCQIAYQHDTAVWTPDRLIREARRWRALTGGWPVATHWHITAGSNANVEYRRAVAEFRDLTGPWPSSSYAHRHFGSWGAFMVACGGEAAGNCKGVRWGQRAAEIRAAITRRMRTKLICMAREQKARGQNALEIAASLGVPASTIRNWTNGGTCVDCGDPTDGSNAAKGERCAGCSWDRQHEDAVWPALRLVTEAKRWKRLTGDWPSTTCWSSDAVISVLGAGYRTRLREFRALTGPWPSATTVRLVFGSWAAFMDACGGEAVGQGAPGKKKGYRVAGLSVAIAQLKGQESSTDLERQGKAVEA